MSGVLNHISGYIGFLGIGLEDTSANAGTCEAESLKWKHKIIDNREFPWYFNNFITSAMKVGKITPNLSLSSHPDILWSYESTVGFFCSFLALHWSHKGKSNKDGSTERGHSIGPHKNKHNPTKNKQNPPWTFRVTVAHLSTNSTTSKHPPNPFSAENRVLLSSMTTPLRLISEVLIWLR